MMEQDRFLIGCRNGLLLSLVVWSVLVWWLFF
jgi:hypothetical protein